MTTFRERRRARRIASDEAHAWARNLRLNNSQAKLTLSMLTLYVDGDGCCYVSVPQLAEDTELSPQTVRRRLAWLEEIGAIARIAQWVDEQGRRNGEARGRRTSDLIRLNLDAEQEAIEARARHESDGDEFSPGSQQGLNSRAGGNSVDVSTATPDPSPEIGSDRRVSPSSVQGLTGADPALALRRPYHCGKGLISEPEPESPPKPPQGGERGDLQDLEESEPELFAPAWLDYPGREIMSHVRHLAVDEFRRLSADDQGWCRRAVPLFAKALQRAGRTKPANFHLWIRARGFVEFPDAKAAAPSAPVSQRRMIRGAELAAVQSALATANRRPIETIGVGGSNHTGSDAGFWARPIEADLLEMAPFARVDRSSWLFVEDGSQQCAAWRKRLQQWLGVSEIELERKWLEPHNPEIHNLPGSDPRFKPRKFVWGLRVPRPFPPRVGGGWADDSGEAA